METENKSRGDMLFNTKIKRMKYLVQNFSQSEEDITLVRVDKKIFLISREECKATFKVKKHELFCEQKNN